MLREIAIIIETLLINSDFNLLKRSFNDLIGIEASKTEKSPKYSIIVKTINIIKRIGKTNRLGKYCIANVVLISMIRKTVEITAKERAEIISLFVLAFESLSFDIKGKNAKALRNAEKKPTIKVGNPEKTCITVRVIILIKQRMITCFLWDFMVSKELLKISVIVTPYHLK